MPRSSLHEPVRILDLACGQMRLAPILSGRYAGRQVEYNGIDMRPELAAAPRRDRNIKSIYHPLKLDFLAPGRLRSQLKRLFGKGKFNEIHVHMLPENLEDNANAPSALKVLSEFLLPGGRIFHILRASSPIMPGVIYSDIEGLYAGGNPGVFSSILRKVVPHARGAGLRVEAYATRGFSQNPEAWIYRRWGGSASARRASDLHRLVAAHTESSHVAHQLVVYRKAASKE
ncbi:MAG TPA: hypothetical protein VJI13_01150 [Candidatus Norongarragalinales archaeon]|nr:hypothetical protein [Candidatus Norongarragalinales archaeon]